MGPGDADHLDPGGVGRAHTPADPGCSLKGFPPLLNCAFSLGKRDTSRYKWFSDFGSFRLPLSSTAAGVLAGEEEADATTLILQFVARISAVLPSSTLGGTVHTSLGKVVEQAAVSGQFQDSPEAHRGPSYLLLQTLPALDLGCQSRALWLLTTSSWSGSRTGFALRFGSREPPEFPSGHSCPCVASNWVLPS
jgi:hypothetical protein